MNALLCRTLLLLQGQSVLRARDRANPLVYLDIGIDGKHGTSAASSLKLQKRSSAEALASCMVAEPRPPPRR